MDENKKNVKIISFSGQEGATGNMTVYECDDDIIIVDCGISFPDDTMPGIDVVIPDFTYLLENEQKIKGLVITHGHEDHLGAVPYLLKELNIPIYTSKIVQELLKERIKDKAGENVLKDVSLHLLDQTTEAHTLGCFKVSAFNVNHSVPNSLGISIETPQGRILHMADFKIDFSPVLDQPIDLPTISRYGTEGVLCLLSDCLGADHKGHSESERTMDETFHKLLAEAENRQFLVTLISSNIARMHQIIAAAVKAGRKVVPVGRSIDATIRIARSLGYLDFHDDTFVTERESNNYLQKDLVYIVAGCFGQSGSAADRISRNEHKHISIEPNGMFVVSSEPGPPGARIPMEAMRDRLVLIGADVIYPNIEDHLHISGHGKRGDLETIATIVNPKYFIPIGGSVSQLRAYTKMVSKLGYRTEQVFELLEGENVVFDEKTATKGKRLEVKQIMIDGTQIGQIGEVVLRDRNTLSTEGVFVVIIPISTEEKRVVAPCEIVTRGFIYVKESRQLLGQAKDKVNKLIDKETGKNSYIIQNWGNLQSKIEKEMEKFLYSETGRKPMLIVQTISV